MKQIFLAIGLLLSLHTQAAPAVGEPFAAILKDPSFKKLYAQALDKSPANHKNSWVYKDIGLPASKAFAGQNGNTWLHASTCASRVAIQCRTSHVDVFYDVQNQQLFAFLTLGSRVGWSGGERSPTALEQKFFAPYLTAKEIR